MKKPQQRFSRGTIWYRLCRKYRNLYRRIQLLLSSSDPSEREVQRLIAKLKNVYNRIERSYLRTGIKLAGTALALTLTTTLAQAQTLTFEEKGIEKGPLSGITINNIYPFVSYADFDNDGDFDAVVGDYYGYVRYFENKGSASEANFVEYTDEDDPFQVIEDAVDYSAAVAFPDLDGDGDMDAVLGDYYGYIKYFENTGTASAPEFTEKTETDNPFYNGGEYWSPSGYRIIPSFEDLNGDGDLDALLGNYYGSIQYLENTGDEENPAFTEKTGEDNPFDEVDEVYYTTPTFGDLDDDGDMDVFYGLEDGTVSFYKNTGTASAPNFVKRTGDKNPFDGIDIGDYSQPQLVDIDDDGDLDALFGEEYSVVYYENTGTASEPNFTAPIDYNSLSAASSYSGDSKPAFVDLDDDGDMDAFVGSSYDGISYYKNTGTALDPVFEEQTGEDNPFDGLIEVVEEAAKDPSKRSSVGYDFDVNPTFVDIDNDGDMDAFIGSKYGDILYFENTGSSTTPDFIERTGEDNPMDGFFGGGEEGGGEEFVYRTVSSEAKYTSPRFADIDGDGDFDAIVGSENGYIYYFENDGSKTEPDFIEKTDSDNPFDGIGGGGEDFVLPKDKIEEVEEESDVISYSNPALLDLDGDGDFDLVIGEYYGGIKYFKNNGTATEPNFVEKTEEKNPFYNIEVYDNSSPAFADIDGDGDMDLFIGDSDGDITFVENVTNAAPIITSDGGDDIASIDLDENLLIVTTVEASDSDGDGITYSLSGGADKSLFSIDGSSGKLNFKEAPNYEEASDSDQDNNYEVEVTATDDGDANLSDTQAITVSIQDAYDKPSITSDGGDNIATIEVEENQTAVTTVEAVDDDGDDITFTISGGDDKSSFAIDESSGVLTFKTPPDFENAEDADTNNDYEVTIKATDNSEGELSDTQTITVKVFNSPIVAGVNDLEDEQLSIFPNPTNGVLNVDWKGEKVISFRIYDFAGKVVMESSGNLQNKKIDLSSYDPGIYVLSIQTEQSLINRKIEKH